MVDARHWDYLHASPPVWTRESEAHLVALLADASIAFRPSCSKPASSMLPIFWTSQHVAFMRPRMCCHARFPKSSPTAWSWMPRACAICSKRGWKACDRGNGCRICAGYGTGPGSQNTGGRARKTPGLARCVEDGYTWRGLTTNSSKPDPATSSARLNA